MHRPNPFVKDDLPYDRKVSDPSAFATLYDQYAAMLLGVITKILWNEAESNKVLEETFTKVHSRLGEFQPEKQPLFIWLLKIARCTALDVIRKRKISETATLQLTPSGYITSISQKEPSPTPLILPDAERLQLKELLDTVLFKNCTPEEAASSLNIPIETARQQLRLAVQQLRTSQLDVSLPE